MGAGGGEGRAGNPGGGAAVRLVGALCAAELLGMMGVFAFPALLPRFLEEWALNHTQAGWISGSYFAGYTVAVPILAGLTDRVDARRVYLASAGVVAAANLGFAWVAQGFWTAVLFRALGGIGLAGTFIPGLKALVDRLAETAQARAVSFYTATFSLGTSLSFFAAGELAARLGWRGAFGAAAGGAAVAFALAAVALRPRGPDAPSAGRAHLLDFRPVLRNRTALGYILAYACHTWELFAFRSWLVAFLAFSLTLQPPGGSHWAPSTVAALTGLVAMWASVGGAELALRFGRRRVITWIMGTSAGFAAAVGFAAALPYPAVAALCVGYALFVQGDSAALHLGTVLSADPTRRGATMAAQSLFGFATASFGPLAVGVMLDFTGGGQTLTSWAAAFGSMGVVGGLGPVVLRLLDRDTTEGGVS